MDKNKKNSELDNSVKKALENYEVPFNVGDWDRMESRLARIAKQAPLGKSNIPLIGLSVGGVVLFIILYLVFSPSSENTDTEKTQPSIITNTDILPIPTPVDTLKTQDVLQKSESTTEIRKVNKKEHRARQEETTITELSTRSTDSTLIIISGPDSNENKDLQTFDIRTKKRNKTIEMDKDSLNKIISLKIQADTSMEHSDKKERKLIHIFKKNTKSEASKDSIIEEKSSSSTDSIHTNLKLKEAVQIKEDTAITPSH